MQVRWHREARSRLTRQRFYREGSHASTNGFSTSWKTPSTEFAASRKMYPKVEGDIHKCKLPRFPYGVIYRTKPGDGRNFLRSWPDASKRRPGYWQSRLR